MSAVNVILSCLVVVGIVASIFDWTFERIEREAEEEAKRIKTQGGPPWKLKYSSLPLSKLSPKAGENMKSIHEIVMEVMADKNHPTELEVFNQPVEEDLIRKLYELKDRHPLYHTCLIYLIESKVMVHNIVENLLAAKQLLDEAGIDFHCIVDANDELDNE